MKIKEERIYVRSCYLKTALYFFYSLCVFSLTTTIIFWERFLLESIMFLFFSGFYVLITLVITYSLFKDYYGRNIRGDTILRKYAIPFIVLNVIVVLMTQLLVYMVPGTESLIYSMMFINYFYMFVVIVSAVFYMIEPVRRLFKFQTDRILNESKHIAARRSKGSLIKGYEIGTDSEIDEILDDIWAHKKDPGSDVKRLEQEVILEKISELGREIKIAGYELKGPEVLKRLRKQKEKYEKML